MSRRGFTLAEIIIVVGVLALMFMVAFIAVQGVREEARMTKDKQNAQILVEAVNAYNAVTLRNPVNLLPVPLSDPNINTLYTALRGMYLNETEVGGGNRVDLKVFLSKDELRRAIAWIKSRSIYINDPISGTRRSYAWYWVEG